MFSFGLLSTHFSYVVFIAAYVFYFFTCSGNKALDGDVAQSSEKIIAQKSISFVIDNTRTSVSFYDVFYATVDDSSKSNIINDSRNACSVRIVTNEKVPGGQHLFKEFSRPPPVVG